MRVLIVGILLLTLGVAAVSTYLIKSFQTPEAIEELERQKQIPKKFVLVAARNLDVGAAIRKEDLSWQVWIDEAIRPEYVVRQEGGSGSDEQLVDPFVGALVRRPIAAAEPMIPGKVFKRDKPGFLSAVLSPGMRAATIPVSPASSAAGFILPGDRVDVLLTHNRAPRVMEQTDTDGGSKAASLSGPYATLSWSTETILQDILVISVDTTTGEVEGQAKVGKTITLEVTPKQAQLLTVADNLGNLTLSLRSVAEGPSDAEEAQAGMVTTDVEASPLLSRLLKRAAEERRQAEERRREEERRAREKAAERAGSGQPQAPKQGITVFRGGSRSTEKVTEQGTAEVTQ